MKPVTEVCARTAVLPFENIDTDRIIPARFLTTTERAGLGRHAFNDWRYREDGHDNPDFPLNRPEAKGCAILVAGRNFGCGSSREHAPWALLDFGFRAILAESFADIFFNNCFKNGILPIVLPAAEIEALLAQVETTLGYTLTIDLQAQAVIRPDGHGILFAVDAFRKECLLNGWDDIGLTLRHAEKIRAFEDRRRTEQPWLFAG